MRTILENYKHKTLSLDILKELFSAYLVTLDDIELICKDIPNATYYSVGEYTITGFKYWLLKELQRTETPTQPTNESDESAGEEPNE